MNINEINLIKKIMNSNSKIKSDLNYIKQTIKSNDYEIMVNSVNILDSLIDDDVLYNYIDEFCDGDITEKNIVDYFNKLIICSTINILGYKLIDKFLNDSFSNSRELYISNYKDKRTTFGMCTIKSDTSSALFRFTLCDSDTFEDYTIFISSKNLNTEPDNISDILISFMLMPDRSRGALVQSNWIKIKDFSLYWIKAQELDSRI